MSIDGDADKNEKLSAKKTKVPQREKVRSTKM